MVNIARMFVFVSLLLEQSEGRISVTYMVSNQHGTHLCKKEMEFTITTWHTARMNLQIFDVLIVLISVATQESLSEPTRSGTYRVFMLQFPRHPVDWCLRFLVQPCGIFGAVLSDQ